jgi:hypothetical protein
MEIENRKGKTIYCFYTPAEMTDVLNQYIKLKAVERRVFRYNRDTLQIKKVSNTTNVYRYHLIYQPKNYNEPITLLEIYIETDYKGFPIRNKPIRVSVDYWISRRLEPIARRYKYIVHDILNENKNLIVSYIHERKQSWK